MMTINKIFRILFTALIRVYQYSLSPLLGPSCRFYPSCSEYAYQAIMRHGPFRGLLLALKRILRCHPFHPGGVDPVPRTGKDVVIDKAGGSPSYFKRKIFKI